MRSEMEVVLRCENDVQVDALAVVDFTMLYVVCLLITNNETRDDNEIDDSEMRDKLHKAS